jgi:hypothetical protein
VEEVTMGAPVQPRTVGGQRHLAVTALWVALVAGLSATAWLAWLSWAVDRPELATWQVVGVVVTLIGAVVVGVARLGPFVTWALVALPFAALGARSIFVSDPLGPIGAAVWVVVVVVGVSVLTAVVTVAHAVLLRRKGARQ